MTVEYKSTHTVVHVRKKSKAEWVCGFGKDAVYKTVHLGWEMCLDNHLSVMVEGDEKPDVQPGQSVEVVVRVLA